MLFLKLLNYSVLAFVVGTSSSTGVKERSKCQIHNNKNYKSKVCLTVLSVITVLGIIALVTLVYYRNKHKPDCCQVDQATLLDQSNTVNKATNQVKTVNTNTSSTSIFVTEVDSLFANRNYRILLTNHIDCGPIPENTRYSNSKESKEYLTDLFSSSIGFLHQLHCGSTPEDAKCGTIGSRLRKSKGYLADLFNSSIDFLQTWLPNFKVRLLDGCKDKDYLYQAEKQYFSKFKDKLPVSKWHQPGQIFTVLLTFKKDNTPNREAAFVNIAIDQQDRQELISERSEVEHLPCVHFTLDLDTHQIKLDFLPFKIPKTLLQNYQLQTFSNKKKCYSSSEMAQILIKNLIY